jgi:hypothetical protein
MAGGSGVPQTTRPPEIGGRVVAIGPDDDEEVRGDLAGSSISLHG